MAATLSGLNYSNVREPASECRCLRQGVDAMIIPERPSFERRVLTALDDSADPPPRIPVVLGGCGTGRTSLLLRLRDLIGRTSCQYVDVERIATTPERFFSALRDHSPFPTGGGAAGPRESGAREAFDATLAFLDTSRTRTGGSATFLLDEFLELRTFESFPGLRTVLRDLIEALSGSANRFVLTSRYPARAMRLLRQAPSTFEVIDVTPLTTAEIRATLAAPDDGAGAPTAMQEAEADRAHDDLARLVQALSDGRPVYARMIADTSATLHPNGADPVSALAALLAPEGALDRRCRFSYELRLHRARGYGALKAILGVLADEEPLTLTEIALRLSRTPGSTKDYLSWLEDIDLIVSEQKRYRFADPLLRLWVRLHGRPVPPGEDDLAREVHAYVKRRVPGLEPALVLAGRPPRPSAREKEWGIIEID